MFTSAFFNACLGTKLEVRMKKMLPSFDCRACNLPSLDECVNMLLFRERDCLKNAITLESLEHFSNKQIHKKNSDEKTRNTEHKAVHVIKYYVDEEYCRFYPAKTHTYEEHGVSHEC